MTSRAGAMAVALLMIGVVIGAALDGDRPSATGSAAKRGAEVHPDADARAAKATGPTKASPRATASKATNPCRAKPEPQPPTSVACDPNIRAKSGTTTCAFAQNVSTSTGRWT